MTTQISGWAGRVPFAGRTREREALRGAVERAIAGRGGLVLVPGEPGAGKTWLADDACEYARSRGAHASQVRCSEAREDGAYGPWRRLLRSISREADALAALLGDASGGSSDLRFRLFDAVTSSLRVEAEGAPLVLELGELHAADVASIRLLRFVAARLREMRVLVIATYREVEVRRDEALAEALDEIAGDAVRLPLRSRTVGDAPMSVLERVPPAVVEAPRPRADRAVLRREGDCWLIHFAGEPFRLKDSKGLRYLAQLVAEAHKRFHVFELTALDEARSDARARRLDLRGRDSYREQLRELRDDLADARRSGDLVRIGSLELRLRLLVERFENEMGLGSAAADLARVNVQRAIGRTLASIGRHDAELGRHLETAIETGAFCSYVPGSEVVRWETEP